MTRRKICLYIFFCDTDKLRVDEIPTYKTNQYILHSMPWIILPIHSNGYYILQDQAQLKHNP